MNSVEPVYPEEYNVACYFIEPSEEINIDFILNTWPNTPNRLGNNTFINRDNTKIEYNEIGPIDPPQQLDDDFEEIYILVWERWNGWTDMLVVGTVSQSCLSDIQRIALDPDIEDRLPSAAIENDFRNFVSARIPHDLRATIMRTDTLTHPTTGPFPSEELDTNVMKATNQVPHPQNPSDEAATKRDLKKIFRDDLDISPSGPLASFVIWMWKKQISLSHMRIPTYDYSAILARAIWVSMDTVNEDQETLPDMIHTIELRNQPHSFFVLDWLDPYVYGLCPYLAWYYIADRQIDEIEGMRNRLTGIDPFDDISIRNPDTTEVIAGQEDLEEFLKDWREFYPETREAAKTVERIEDQIRTNDFTHQLPLTQAGSQSDYSAETLPELMIKQCTSRASEFDNQLSRLTDEYDALTEVNQQIGENRSTIASLNLQNTAKILSLIVVALTVVTTINSFASNGNPSPAVLGTYGISILLAVVILYAIGNDG